jgi:hypothetical protein
MPKDFCVMRREVFVTFTLEEASELFSRCLSSALDDTEESLNALHKLAEAMHSTERFHPAGMEQAA